MHNFLQASHLFYCTWKMLMQYSQWRKKHGNQKLWLRVELFYAANFLWVLGELVTSFLLLTCGTADLKPNHYWTPMINIYLSRNGIFDAFFCLVAMDIILVALYSIKTYYFTPFCDLQTGKLLYQLLVVNYDHYQEALIFKKKNKPKHFKIKNIFNQSTSDLKSLINFNTMSQNVDFNRFSKKLLKHLETIAPKLRLKLIWMQRLAEVDIEWSYKSTLFGYCLYIYQLSPIMAAPYFGKLHPILIALYLAQEYFTSGILQMNFMMKINCMLVFLTWFLSVFYTSHIGQINHQLSVMANRMQTCRPFPSNRLSLSILTYYLQEHTRSVCQILTINNEFFGHVILMLFFNVIPVHAIVVSRVLFKPTLDFSDRIACLVISLMQLAMISGLMFPLAHLSKTLHQSSGSHPRIQLWLECKHLHYKLKLDSLHQRLTDKTQYGFKVGPFAIITKAFIFEIISIYVGYFMFILKIIT